MIIKQSIDPVFDQVRVRLSDAADLNRNQKFLILKNPNFRWTFDVNIAHCLYFLEYTWSSSLKSLLLKQDKFLKKYSVINFREASGRVL